MRGAHVGRASGACALGMLLLILAMPDPDGET